MIQTGLIGKNHTTQLEWLSDTWIQSGPPVCFLEGFPGIGKTTVARYLLEKVHATGIPTILITAPESSGDPTDDILLDLAMELSIVGKEDLANAVDDGHSLTKVLHKIIETPILIIIDEFQRTMKGKSGRPGGGFAKVLSTMADRKWLNGRVLLLTNRLVERAKWSEAYAIRRLQGMEIDDGVQLLKQLLDETEQINEIPDDRCHDVVACLGGNPRAVRVLTASLMYDSLDELIGLNPELWETKDRYVSAELVGNLERELLERTLSQLSSDEYNRNLNRLSVHRKPFKREATEIIFSDKTTASEFRRVIINRFLMEQHFGWFNLHPIVREIGLQKLRQSTTELLQAHDLAAQYFTRHFSAKQVVGWGRLGGYFVEARYHLTNAGRADELGEIATRFENHIRSTINLVSPVPKDAEELDERIAVLSALLETSGAKGLEYHLARCFQARSRRNDLERAITHARRALGQNAPAPTWILCANLLSQSGQTAEAIELLKDGITKVPAKTNLFSLYQSAGELLAQSGQTAEAIELLKDGIGKVPVGSVVSLYQSAGELLAQSGQTAEAIELLKDGIGKVPVGSVVSLYQSAGELLAQSGQTAEAIELLKDGITKVPAKTNLFSLYQSAGELLAQSGQTAEAIELLKDGIGKVPVGSVVSLYQSAGELLAQSGQTAEAIELLKDGIGKVPVGSVVSLYQSAGELLAQSGQTAEAIELLKDGIGKVPVGSVVSLYQSAGELLAQSGQTAEAIELLKDGIGKVPVGSVVSLYQSAGELLAQSGQTAEAIELLKDGITKVPAKTNLFSLYTLCAYTLAKIDRLDEAIALLKEGIARIPAHNVTIALYLTAANLLGRSGRLDEEVALLEGGVRHLPIRANLRYKLFEPILNIFLAQQNIQAIEDLLSQANVLDIGEQQVAYCKILRLIIRRDWEAAAQTAQQESVKFPRYRPILETGVFCWICANNWNAAKDAYQRMQVESKPGDKLEWLKAWIALKSGDRNKAKYSLSVFLNRPIDDQEVNEHFLIRLWKTIPTDINETILAFYFPILPSSLTGLPNDMVLTQYGSGVPSQMSSRQEDTQSSQVIPAPNHITVSDESELPNWPAWMDEVLNPSGDKSYVDLGIVIALEEEFRELAPQIKTRAYYNSDIKQYYYLFERSSVNAALTPYRCVVTFMGTMGPTDAGMVGDRLIAQFNPATIVSIGIAGSMDKDVLVGDIVVADQTDEYLASSKAVETKDKQDWAFQFSGNPYKSDPTYVAHAMNLKYAYRDATQTWEKDGKQKLLGWIGSVSTEKLIREHLIGDVPGIKTGHVASGPTVGAANQFAQWLKVRRDRKLLALEMESAGVLNAAHKRAVSSLIIRGISDYSDDRKKKLDEIGGGALRRYAMNNALALLWVLMDLRLINSTG